MIKTVLDNLLIYGINSSNREISTGAIRHLPIILLKHFKDSKLDLTRLIRYIIGLVEVYSVYNVYSIPLLYLDHY